MKRIATIVFCFVCCGFVTAQTSQTAQQEIKENIYLSGSNYLDYDRQLSTTPLTATPKGYEPFYMSHYGRHGSRWLIGEGDYTGPLNTLRDANAAGKLTAKGKEVLKKLEDFYPTTIRRLGELTTVGERQHHGIGSRMAKNFPEIFKAKNVAIDARSTVVIRCILSMEAECEELAAANPTVRIHNDVSESFQYYLNQDWSDRMRRASRQGRGVRSEYERKYSHPERLMKVLFNDQSYVYDNIRASSLMRQLFEVASNMQSHDTDIELYSLFTDDEIYDQWRIRNIGWYLDYGAAPQSRGMMPFTQLNLLRNIIETADTIVPPYPGVAVPPAQDIQATLRFGHEVCVMPLACLLELGQCGAQVENLDTLDNVWRNYRIFPMACNVQLIFYRPVKGKPGDILVKAMLNEREMTLPVQPVSGPYYKWADLRQYYLDKIQKFEEGK
ncbi:MAG: histidine-type phosphatase [Prevotella sp.]|jgi:hypothetical protein|nr:histidine-type phosphatase [Prevotella sp.]